MFITKPKIINYKDKKNKDKIIIEFIETIKESHIYKEMLTPLERKSFLEMLENEEILKNINYGTRSQKWDMLATIYNAYLCGCGYCGVWV